MVSRAISDRSASASCVIRAGLQPGPYVAETFPVSIEQQHVVVDAG
ncbi:MAG: hypothetical protein JOY61_18985 [Chloroflexi bacterium]|nr:hypothetical protein [Chloroflexota bacterium]